MDWLIALLTNKFLLTGTSAWAVAQVLKTMIHFAMYKKLELERLLGDGGMPSGHSATVTSLATVSALSFGLDSYQFAISAILAIIVCHDATGVRRETGKQAVLLNEMTRIFNILSSEELPEVKLKEFVGHSPLQVLVGGTLGVLVALVMHFAVFA